MNAKSNIIRDNIDHLISEFGTVYVRRDLIAAFGAYTVRECRTKKHNFLAHTWDELGNMIAIDRVGRFVQLFPNEPGYVR